jgi:hypothetical protein
MSVDYDPSVNFSDLKTYSWVGRKNPEITALEHQQIISILDSNLEKKGFKNVDLNPDIYVTYYTDDNDRVVIDTSRYGYSTGPGWNWGVQQALALGGPGPQVRVYNEGSLAVDLILADDSRLIWRGVVVKTLSGNPKANEGTVRKGASQLFKYYPPS